MLSFKNFNIIENCCTSITSGGTNLPEALSSLNQRIMWITEEDFLTPYIALERISKVLAIYHIFIPKQNMEDEYGIVLHEITKITNSESYDPKLFFYMEYQMNEFGMFDIYSEIVNESDLNEILNDIENEEEEEEDTTINEV